MILQNEYAYEQFDLGGKRMLALPRDENAENVHVKLESGHIR